MTHGRATKTLVFGPRLFEDFPLVQFLNQGLVFGVDINSLIAREVKIDLNEIQKKRLAILNLDASLFASPMLNETERIIKNHPFLTDHVLNELTEVYSKLQINRQLPFVNQSMNLIVSISCIFQFLGFASYCVLTLLDQKYGEREVENFFLENEGRRFDQLASILNKLLHKTARVHLQEIQRILSTGGVAFLTDHSLRIELVNDTGFFTTFTQELKPAYDFAPATYLKTEEKELNVEIGNIAKNLIVSGKDHLSEFVKEVPGLRILKQFYFWNLNYPAKSAFGIPGRYFLDSAFILEKT